LLRQLDIERARRGGENTAASGSSPLPPASAGHPSPPDATISIDDGGNGKKEEGQYDSSSDDDDVEDVNELGWSINTAITKLRAADSMVIERTFRWVDANCNGLLDYEVTTFIIYCITIKG
jgi:hypothetical protein